MCAKLLLSMQWIPVVFIVCGMCSWDEFILKFLLIMRMVLFTSWSRREGSSFSNRWFFICSGFGMFRNVFGYRMSVSTLFWSMIIVVFRIVVDLLFML